MAEDRLPCCRLLSISPTSSDNVMSRSPEISFMPFQNASSRLTLVLCPATTIERFTTGDFMTRPRHRRDADPADRPHVCCVVRPGCVRIWCGRTGSERSLDELRNKRADDLLDQHRVDGEDAS